MDESPPPPPAPSSGDNAGEKEPGECSNGPEASGVDTASAMSKTTTISTIAVQSGKTRIVIALLHCGDWLDLKVLEITPDLASLGNTLQEALELQKAHDEVLRQLQNKQSPVEELLRQADHLISTQKPRAEVYAAMAESLGRAWKDINLHLEFRKQILDLNVQYHTHARDFFTKVEELEASCKDTVVPIEIDAVKRFLTDIHDIRRALLEAHMNALQTGNSLINKLKELGAKGTLDSRPDRIRTSVNRAISQVQEWMDELHTKRQILETTFVKRKAQLEQCLALAILAVDLKEVEEAVNKGRDALTNSNELGDSSSSTELLLQWHRKLLPEAQQLQERALKITKATEQLEASGCFASEQAKDQAYKVLSTTSDYLTEISEHNMLLEKVINFFRTAQTAFTKLDQLEIQLQTIELPSSSPQLARLHAQCAETIANLTTPPIELGHNILHEAKPGRGTEGVRRTVEELENRKITLEGLCTAHREDKLRINKALNEFLEKHEELYSWLKSIAEAFLQGHQDMGTDYSLAKDFLDLHNQLLNDLQTKGNEINSLLLTLPPILEYLEDDQRRDVDAKVESLHEHWVKLKNILEKRLDLASIYVKFHNEANRVNDKIDKLEESLRSNVGNTHEDIFRRMEEEWEQIVPLYQSAKNTGITFINETKKMSEPHLDTKRACVCVESVLEKLSNRQVSVTRTWQTYKTDVEERREVHLQWEQIIMQSSKTLDWVTKLESQLYPLIDTFSTSPNEIINHLEQKQETVLPEIRRAQNEVEQRIKMTETLISKSSQIDEQSLNIKNKLIELNQKLIEISSEYQILLQVLIGFFKNVVELDKTTENLNSQFGKAGLPQNAADVELLIREHEASRQAVLEMFRFTQNECDQLKSRIIQQEPKTAAEQDISKLETMLESRKVRWEEEWKRRRESLESQKKISHFNSELKIVDENIDELGRQLSGFKEQCRESQSTTKTVAQTFTHFTKVTETLDIRVKNLVKEGEKLVNENHLQSPQIEFNLNQLQEKWSNFKKDTHNTKHLIELSTKYYEIVNEADQWLKDGSRILVSVAKRTSAIKRPEEAQQLLHEVENFVKPGQEKQTERIHSISQLSKELFSPGWSKEETEIQIQHKEIIESFSSIISELHILSQNLKLSEEQHEKLKREQAEADAKLAAAKAEAERARHAAKIAEEEKRAAEEAKRAAEDAKRVAEEAKITAESAVKTLQESMTSQTVKEIQIVREEVPQQAIIPMVPPIFISPLSDVVIQEGAKFTFMCTVTGTPTPVVTWYKDGISIQNNPDYQTSFEHGLCTLTIEETFAEDSARYSCKAVNAAGSAETGAFLAVKEPQQEEQLVPPTFVKLLQPGFTKEGSKFQFECKVEGYPLPTVQWFKGNECIDNSPDYVITYNNGEAILKFEKVTINDKAEYTCKATNKLGVAQSRTNLNIEPAQPMEAPFFAVPLSNVMARAGQKIKLECEVTGVPTPVLTWTQNGKTIKESRDLKLLREGKRATLVISEAFPKDAGTFAVTASNTAGEAISSSNVTVKGRLPTETSDSELASDMEPIKPTIQVALKDASVFEGQKVRLDCVIVGQPEPEVIWYRDDIPVKESSDFQLLFQGDRCSLIIQEAFSEDAGEYKVVALNSAGEASSKCKLIVTPLSDKQPAPKPPHEEMNATGSPPKFSKLLSDVLVSENERVIFEATVCGQPRPEIKWLLNNQEIIESNRTVTTYDQQGNVSLQIDSVKPEDRGVYTVKAQNLLGEAKCFAQLIVKTAKPVEIQKPFEDIKSPPFFNERFTDRTVADETSTKFECIVTGKPTPKVRWFFNDEPVSGKGFLVSTSGDRQVLTIPTVTKKNEGKITCIAENEAGTSTWSAKLSVQPSLEISPFPPKPSTEIQRHVESSYILKQDVQVESSSSVKKISSDSEPQIQTHTIKSHDEKSVTQTNQEQPKVIESHKVEEYRTFGDNEKRFSSITDETMKEKEHNLITQKKIIKLRPPKFINPIMGKIVDQNTRVVLEGIVDGQPTPTISWTKNGTELRQTDNVKISYDMGRPKVEILNATSNDAGRYTCTAVNEAGSAVSTSDLVVRKIIFPPVFGRRLQAQVVKKGERIRMEIEVTGTPEPTVSWYKDGIPLTSEPREGRRILRQGNSYTLIIEKAELKDQGKYMVRAVNEGGEAQSIADFAVYEPTPDTMMEVVKTVVFEDVRKHEMLSSTEDKTKSVSSTEQRIPVSTKTFDSSTFALPEIEKSIVTKKEIFKSTTPTNLAENFLSQSSESHYHTSESRISHSSESKSESKSENFFTKESAQPPTIVRSVDNASFKIPEIEKSVVSKTEIFKSSSPINLQDNTSKSSESQVYSSTSSKYGELAKQLPDIAPQSFSTVDSARYVFPDGEKSVVSKTEVYRSSTPYGSEEKKIFQTSSSSMSQSHSSTSEKFVKSGSSVDNVPFPHPEIDKSVVSIFKSSPINVQEHVSKSHGSQAYSSTLSSQYGDLAKKGPEVAPQSFSTIDNAKYVFPDGESSVVSKSEVFKTSTPYGSEEKKVFQTSSSSMSQSHSSTSEKFVKTESSADRVQFPHPEIDKSVVSTKDIFKSSTPINVQDHISKSHGSQAYSSTFSSQYGDLAKKGPEVAPHSFSTIDSAKYVFPDGESSVVSKSEVFKSSTPYGTQEKKVFQTSSSSMSQSYTSGSEKLIKSESSTGTTPFPEMATKTEIFKSSDLVKREPEIAPQGFSTVDSARYIFPDGEKSVVSKSEVYQSTTPYGTQEKKIFQTSSSSVSQSYSSSGDKLIKSESSTDKGAYSLPEAPTSLISKTEIIRRDTPSEYEKQSFLQSSSQSQFTKEVKKEPFTTTIIDSASYTIPDIQRSVVSKTEISKTSTPYSHLGETLTSEGKASESSMFSQSQQSFMKETQVSKESKVIKLDHPTPEVPKVPSLPKFTVPEVPITHREVILKTDVSGPVSTETKKESFVGEGGFQTSSKQSTIDFSVKKIYKGDESETKKEIQHTSIPTTTYKRYEEISKPVIDTGYKTSTFQRETKTISSEIPTKFSDTVTTKEEFVLKPEPPPEICYAPIPETHEDTTFKTTTIETHTELPTTDQTAETKSFASAQKHFQELSRKEETHSSRKFETAESVHKRTRSASPKPNEGAIAMEKLWTKQRSFEYETPPSVSSSYSYSVERQTTAPRTVSALSTSSQEQSFERSHEEKSYSTQSTLEKKWTPFEKRHESRIEKTRVVSAPEPMHYVAEVTGLQHQFKHDSFQETAHSEGKYLKDESSREHREEIKEEVNLKPSQLKKTWPPPSSEEHVSSSYSKIISASSSITPSVHSLSVRPVSVQDITDEVYLEPGPPPEIGYAPPIERRQSYVELIEQDLERNLEKEPTKLPTGAVRTIPPPLPPKNEQYQPPPLPAKPIKFVEPPKKVKKEVESKPFERFPDLEPFPFSPEPVKPKPLKAGPPPTPSKFVKGRFTDSDYESDIEAVRIPAKWKPCVSDTEEPSYKKVRPPTVSPSFRSRSVEPEPLPPSKFDQPPESSGPPRPTIDFRKTIKRDAALERKLARHSYPKAQEPPRQPVAPAEPILKPGSPPIFMEAPPLPRQKPESPKVKHKPIIVDGYMADTDEPRTLARKTFKEDNVKMEQKQTLYSDANFQKTYEQTRTSHAPAPRIYKKHVSSSTKKELVSTPIITNISTTETVTEKQDRSETRESYNYQTEASKSKRIRGPPPPSPSKFVKGEFRESDYESDYDGKRIPPVWTPQDTPVEKTYKPVRPILTPSGRHSQTSTGRRTPTPPTEFDNPPQISGPPRPKFEPIEKPAPTVKIDKFMRHEEKKQVVHKPKPVTAKQQPITDVIIATPAVPEREIYLQPGTPPEIGFAPGPQATQYYKSTTSTPYHNAVQTETSNVMHFKESTENSQRTVSLQQTRKVITFGKQDSSSSSQYTSERRRSAPPPTRPKKFIPGEFRESDYESEVETAKIRPLWIPSESDNEEPRYRKVKPPQPTRSLSLPGEEYSASVETKSSSRQESNQSSYYQKMSKEESSRSQSSKQTDSSKELVYQPGPRPEYGYMPEKIAKSEATKLASKHMEDMTHSFKSKTQNFVSDIMNDITKKKTSSTTDKRNGESDAQVYREESRAAQYGTKHVDPDTGLIYFKYDFGYEFGIILPGEGKSGEIPVPKKTIIEPPKRSRDIEMPVYHETTKSQGAPTNKLTVPSKTVRWEPTSESEMSEYESEGRKKGIGNRWEQSSASPVSLSPSLPSTSPAFNQYGSGRGETPTSTPGTSTPGSTSASFSTRRNPQAQRAPLFITPLRDIAVVKGQAARFECIVQSETTPTVLWSKDGMIISNTPNHQLFFRNGVCRLTIPQAYPDDAGTYSCTATNPVGAVSTSATLQVPGERRSQYI